MLNSVKAHGFQLKSVEPHHKDGGVFVKFGYDPGASEEETLNKILEDLRENVAKNGGMPSWTGLPQAQGDVWLVKGKPWREVCVERALVIYCADQGCVRT